MSHRFDEYLHEVSAQLRGLDDARRAEIVAELRSHLVLSTRSAVEELAVPVDEAEQLAMRSLGNAKNVAEDLVLQEKGVSGRPGWRLALVPILLDLLLITLLPLGLALTPVTYRQISLLSAPTLLGPLVPIAFGWAVWKSRRWLVAPIAGSIFLSLVFACLVVGSPVYQSFVGTAIGSVDPEMATAEGQLRALDRQIEDARAGETGFRQRHSANPSERLLLAPRWEEATYAYSLPYMPTTIEVPQPKLLALGVVDNVNDGATLWRQNGDAMVKSLENDRLKLIHPPAVWQKFWELLPLGLLCAGARILQLALVNWLLLLVANLRRFRRHTKTARLARR